jgi:predicted transcriptional regulator
MAPHKRTLEVDSDTAAALEHRAAETGLSVSDLLAEMVARQHAPAEASAADIAELDRQWAAIKAGEPTVPHDSVVRWLDTWGKRDPFATFTEWSGEADKEVYADL